MSSPEFTDQLARAYREARALVLGDRSPKVDRAFALHREFEALRAGFLEALDGGRSEWDAQLLENTRRATIVALRHQALLVGDRWTENTSPHRNDPSTVRVNPEHALQLASAALDLHLESDPDKARTTEVVESLRRQLAEVRSSPLPLLTSERTNRLQTEPVQEMSPASEAVLAATSSSEPSNDNLIPTPLSPSGRQDTPSTPQHMRRASSAPLFFKRASVSFVVLAAAALAFFAISVGKSGSAVTSKTRQGPSPSVVTAVRRPETAVRVIRSTSSLLPAGGRYEAALRSGIELYKQGWFGPAIGRFKEAAAINPRSAEAHLWWGRALTKANRQSEARGALEKVIVLAQTGPLADEANSLLKKLR